MQDLDLSHAWLPFTPNRDFRDRPRLFARADGVHYYTPDGRAVLDGSSGLFTTPAGHGRREIADAVHRQLLELDFAPSFQRSHPKAFEAAKRVATLTPEGLDKIFKEAGYDWREAGCSMCLGMNPDILQPGERCASTSNRNFEGRQGFKGRTHLVSPTMAAAAAIAGRFVDIRTWS